MPVRRRNKREGAGMKEQSVLKRHAMIFDTDLGTDDALAFMLWKVLEGSGPDYVLAEAGNTTMDNACRNAVLLRRMTALNSVIVRGREAENLPVLEAENTFHGTDGFADIGDAAVKKLGITPAELADVMPFEDFVRRIRRCDAVTYLSVGPITTLAALLEDPAVHGRITRLYVMGGGLKEFNCPHDTEFNFSKNPQAVKKLLSCGLPITLFPLDLTNHQCVTEEDIAELAAYGSYPEILTLLRCNLASNTKYDGIPAAVLHDTMPVLYSVYPDKFTVSEKSLSCDDRGRIFEDAAGCPVRIAEQVEEGLLMDLLRKLFASPEIVH